MRFSFSVGPSASFTLCLTRACICVRLFVCLFIYSNLLFSTCTCIGVPPVFYLIIAFYCCDSLICLSVSPFGCSFVSLFISNLCLFVCSSVHLLVIYIYIDHSPLINSCRHHVLFFAQQFIYSFMAFKLHPHCDCRYSCHVKLTITHYSLLF
jgi:hypothetical protein